MLIRYGIDDFGYRFWDEQNCKIIHNKDVKLSEQVIYEDMFCTRNTNNTYT